MKKVYSKPEIAFEDFSVSATIAAGCERKCNNNVGDCAFELPYGNWTMYIFNVDVAGPCTDGIENLRGTENDGLCYHIPSGFNTFDS